LTFLYLIFDEAINTLLIFLFILLSTYREFKLRGKCWQFIDRLLSFSSSDFARVSMVQVPAGAGPGGADGPLAHGESGPRVSTGLEDHPRIFFEVAPLCQFVTSSLPPTMT
jgi:hypothetical protein